MLLHRKKNIIENIQPESAGKKPENPVRRDISRTSATGQAVVVSEAGRKIALNPFTLVVPRITEKASLGAEKQVYTFTVALAAVKADVAQAVRALYGVTPRKVHVSTIPRKKKFTRGKRGRTALGKKAYVYLKRGDTIESL